MATTQLTEREAWLKIAEWFSKERVCVAALGAELFAIEAGDEYVSGMCKATSALYRANLIDDILWKTMREKLVRNRPVGQRADGYYWPENAEGDKQRVAFCKEQAERCK